MKTILITGASGMLGAFLVSKWQKKYRVYATGNSNFEGNQAERYKIFDLKKRNYKELSDWVKPDYIIHCAAITSHEECVRDSKKAFLINSESVKKLLKAFKRSKIFFISTDAVFPLGSHMATEKSKIRPATIYGKTKKIAEGYLLKSKRENCVIRTTIVGKNINKNKISFVDRIYGSLRKKKSINLFEDVIFTPISILSFANHLQILIESKKKLPKIVHITGSESISKFDFGLKFCKIMNLDCKKINKARLEDQKSIIKRSYDQSLNVSLFENIFKKKLPNIKNTMKELKILFTNE